VAVSQLVEHVLMYSQKHATLCTEFQDKFAIHLIDLVLKMRACRDTQRCVLQVSQVILHYSNEDKV
jgi:hypothetical protein